MSEKPNQRDTLLQDRHEINRLVGMETQKTHRDILRKYKLDRSLARHDYGLRLTSMLITLARLGFPAKQVPEDKDNRRH